MLVTFHCKGYSNLTFFGDVATQLLQWMGHSGTVPSALRAEDVPDALALLQRALDQQPEVSHHLPSFSTPEHTTEHVALRHRALPLVDLLRYAVEHKHHVMWDKA